MVRHEVPLRVPLWGMEGIAVRRPYMEGFALRLPPDLQALTLLFPAGFAAQIVPWRRVAPAISAIARGATAKAVIARQAPTFAVTIACPTGPSTGKDTLTELADRLDG